MIFISYNHKDADLIDTIARRLEIEFGRSNIFYDSWSMQPGDGIIEKMDEGLGEALTFFFFISENSLESNMVKLEWQTALNKSVKGKLKFVPVRLDDSNPPAILTDKLYIDLYNIGIDEAITQMKLVVNRENNYQPKMDIINVNAELLSSAESKASFRIQASHFTEHGLSLVFIFDSNQDMSKINVGFPNRSGIMETNSSITATFDTPNGVNEFKGYSIAPLHPLKPKDDWVLEVTGIENNSLKGLGRFYSDGRIELLKVTQKI